MPVFTEKREYCLKGKMDKIVIDEDINKTVSASGISEGYVMVFVAGCVATLAVTEAEPGIMKHDMDHLFSSALGMPYGRGFADGTPYRHHETWHDDNGSSHLRAMLMHHSISIPILAGRALLGPWQNIVLVECDTGPRERVLWFQVQGE